MIYYSIEWFIIQYNILLMSLDYYFNDLLFNLIVY